MTTRVLRDKIHDSMLGQATVWGNEWSRTIPPSVTSLIAPMNPMRLGRVLRDTGFGDATTHIHESVNEKAKAG